MMAVLILKTVSSYLLALPRPLTETPEYVLDEMFPFTKVAYSKESFLVHIYHRFGSRNTSVQKKEQISTSEINSKRQHFQMF